MMGIVSFSSKAEHLPHIWKDQYIGYGWWSVAKHANNDNEMNESDTWYELRQFFNGCATISDFYNAIVRDIGKAMNEEESMAGNSRDLSEIVDAAMQAMGKRNPAKYKLLCHQHAILFAAGVKAVYSEWDETRQRYVMWSTKDFKFIFWCGDHGPRHVQLVIDVWKDDDTPNGAEYFEVDTWDHDYGAWTKTYLPKNSKMWSE